MHATFHFAVNDARLAHNKVIHVIINQSLISTTQHIKVTHNAPQKAHAV